MMRVEVKNILVPRPSSREDLAGEASHHELERGTAHNRSCQQEEQANSSAMFARIALLLALCAATISQPLLLNANPTNFQSESTAGNGTDIIIRFADGNYNCNKSSYRWTSKQIGIQGDNSTVFTDCYFLFLGGGNQTFRISDISFSNYSNSKGNVVQANSGLSFHFKRVKFLQTITGDVIFRNRSDLSTVIVYSRITLYIDECIFSGMKDNGRMIYLRQAIGHISNTIFRNSPGCTAIALALDATTQTYYNITMENVIMDGLSTGILGTLLTPFNPLYVNVSIHNLTCTLTGAGSSVVDLSVRPVIAAYITVSDSSFIGGNEALNNLFVADSGPNQFTVLRTTFNNLRLPLYKCIFSTRGTARVLISDVTVKNITGPVCNVMSNVYNDETDDNRVPLSSLVVRHSSFESTVVPTSALFTFVSSNIDVENCTFIKVDTLLGAIYHRSASESLSLVSIRRSTFQTVSSIDDGGAVSLTGSFNNVSVTDCSFTDIISEGAGGSIFIIGRAELVDVRNVNVSNSISTDGGHMYISLTGGQSQVTIDGCRLVEGVASNNGGGILLSGTGEDMTVTMSNLFMHSNHATSRGGSINCQISSGTFNLSNTTISNSDAVTGGGLFLRGAPEQIDIHHIQFIGNKAINQGGSIHFGTTGRGSIDMNDVTVTGSSALFGGAVAALATIGEMSVVNNLISNSSAQQGAAFWFSSLGRVNVLAIHKSNVTNNKALLDGGAGYITTVDRVTMDGVQMHQNSAGGNGGAFCLSSANDRAIEMDITESAMTENTANTGGAISVTGGRVQMNIFDTSLSQNSAVGNGGAIFYQGTGNSDRVNISDSQVSGNEANGGGGLYVVETTLVTDGLTMNDNKALTQGGALYYQKASSTKRQTTGQLTSNHDTFKNNSAGEGGAMFVTGDAAINSGSFDRNIGNGSDISSQGGAVNINSSTMSSDGYSLWVGNRSRVQSRDTQMKGVFLSSNSSTFQAQGLGSDAIQLTCPAGQNVTVGGDGSSTCQEFVSNTSIPFNYISTDKRTIGIAVGVSVGFFAIIASIAAFLIWRRHKQQREELEAAKHNNEFDMQELAKIDLGDAKRCLIDFDELKDKQYVGNGSFGVVYRATWRQLTVAVKQILSDSVSAIQLKDFLGEVAILQGVRSHPNVVTFMGLTFPPQPLSLVTEFCHGGGLDSYLTKNEIPLESLKPIMRGIALGMNHLHSEGIIHRDLAARNILLTQHLEPKVSDFGMSRRAEEGVGMTQTAIGPVRWMAPEAITSRVYSTKSDVYSFGVLIWEMVSGGKLPYEDMDTVEAAVAVVANGLRPLIPDDMKDGDLMQLMSLCWTTQPEGRPEFRVILNRYLSGTTWVEELSDEEPQETRYVSTQELDAMTSDALTRPTHKYSVTLSGWARVVSICDYVPNGSILPVVKKVVLRLAQLCIITSSSHLVAAKEQKDGMGKDVGMRSKADEFRIGYKGHPEEKEIGKNRRPSPLEKKLRFVTPIARLWAT
ncbi:hypothetical protein PROFUN_14775 [Planoprotostelium fungivorum]|uniref:Protein kinase domain-containing protein n=1 Tax=Planoprotostelium fungivorum TaxID=1890364 RepID=A0A2P6MYR8_9EUKA|nr:hypothetical protein PROFUN_14775 [Planoprotostelium fungivorum]